MSNEDKPICGWCGEPVSEGYTVGAQWFHPDCSSEDKLERIVHFAPAYDKRHSDPKKNYGIHGVELRMVLKGQKGAVQFVLFTNWHLPHVQEEMDKRTIMELEFPDPNHKYTLSARYRPLPADLGYHSPKPMYEGQEMMGAVEYKFEETTDELDLAGKKVKIPKTTRTETGTFKPCEYLDGKPCYYDGSGLAASKVYEILLTEGDEGVWRYLEEYYHDRFDEKEEEKTA